MSQSPLPYGSSSHSGFLESRVLEFTPIRTPAHGGTPCSPLLASRGRLEQHHQASQGFLWPSASGLSLRSQKESLVEAWAGLPRRPGGEVDDQAPNPSEEGSPRADKEAGSWVRDPVEESLLLAFPMFAAHTQQEAAADETATVSFPTLTDPVLVASSSVISLPSGPRTRSPQTPPFTDRSSSPPQHMSI